MSFLYSFLFGLASVKALKKMRGQDVVITRCSKRFIGYYCENCQKPVLTECLIKESLSDSDITGLNKRKAFENARYEMDMKIRELDKDLFIGFNIDHDYTNYKDKEKCPNCGKIQTWSSILPKFKKTKNYLIWQFFSTLGIFFTCFLVLFAVFTDNPVVLISIILIIAIPLVGFYPFYYKKKRKKTIEAIKITDNSLYPIYYNEDNIQHIHNHSDFGRLFEKEKPEIDFNIYEGTLPTAMFYDDSDSV